MALIVLLILSQDENFNKSVHEVVSMYILNYTHTVADTSRNIEGSGGGGG